ncbi:ECF transporter S component [Limosilactobacillus agrestis]|nr:ECF transporter S component [Limosilactobacillus agrestis]MCD7120954.1 ECF transporter S component [Limosilactobacillus agrestis]MCD7126983.1 ECF transporter S component [Limosilactobacillus agrestis]
MESTFRLRRSIVAAMLLALTLVLGRFFLIPIPWTHGNVNLCDAGVFIAANAFRSRSWNNCWGLWWNVSRSYPAFRKMPYFHLQPTV